MGWAKIKKAINSTLGTDEFKPLDKLILGEKRFVAHSDIILHSFITNSVEIGTYKSEKFVSKLDGTLLLKIQLSGGSGAHYGYEIYENDVLLYEENWINLTNLHTYYLKVAAGNKYHIEIDENYSGTVKITTLELCGMVMDTNYFTIESE